MVYSDDICLRYIYIIFGRYLFTLYLRFYFSAKKLSYIPKKYLKYKIRKGMVGRSEEFHWRSNVKWVNAHEQKCRCSWTSVTVCYLTRPSVSSVAWVGSDHVTAADVCPLSARTVTSFGHTSAGGVLSINKIGIFIFVATWIPNALFWLSLFNQYILNRCASHLFFFFFKI